MKSTIDQYFGISNSGSTISIEVRAAFTTFLAMAYILFVNPQILGQGITVAGDANIHAQLLSSTAIAAAVGSIMMGVFAKYPIAVAPGMGLNAYFVFSVVINQGVSWRVALGAVFVSGIVFLMLSLSGVRDAVIRGIPLALKRATAAGIGLFLAFIGFSSSGIVIAKPNTLIGLGDLSSASVLLTLVGLILAVVLMIRKVPGALLISIVTTSATAILFSLAVFNGKPFAGVEHSIISLPVWPTDLIGAMDLTGALQLPMAGVVFTFLFVAFFDTAGTLIGLSEKAHLVDQEGHIPRASQVFTTDAVATTVGACLGVSTTTAYVESAAGMEEGGKTGLVAVVVGILFLLSLFLWPIATMVPASATAPALIILGAMMMDSVGKIAWNDYRDSVPAFLTMIMMPLTWSISNGIGAGIISYVLIRLLTGDAKSIHPVMYGLACVLAVKFGLAGG